MAYPREEIEATVERLMAAFKKAEAQNSWSFIADEFYHKDAKIICEYGGVMNVVSDGVDEIRRLHYGRDMDVGSGWHGWTFPYMGYAINGDLVITHWMNRGPGKRPDGSYYETDGISIITYGGDGKFIYQKDIFDILHQMLLCDELEEAGLLLPALKKEWVEPMKARIRAALDNKE